MAFEFVALQASEQQNLIRFLVTTFRADPSLVSFRPEVVNWKYFSRHPEWTSPRSYAAKENGQIVAHGGIWPVDLNTLQGRIKAIHLIDWAATRSAVGAGVYLLRKLASLNHVLLTIGGSPDTRSLLPKLGYKSCGELKQYARVIRPWSHFRTSPARDWKARAKFIRNSLEALKGIPPAPRAWHASRLAHFDETHAAILENGGEIKSAARSAAGWNHLLGCPAAAFSAFLITRGHEPCGYFVFSKIGKQVRIVDLRVRGDRDSWRAAAILAARTAASDPEVCEIVAASSVGPVQDAWRQSGFAQRRVDPIFCFDAQKILTPDSSLDLNLADGDQCFLHDPESPYVS